jgi:hypothetical protein
MLPALLAKLPEVEREVVLLRRAIARMRDQLLPS